MLSPIYTIKFIVLIKTFSVLSKGDHPCFPLAAHLQVIKVSNYPIWLLEWIHIIWLALLRWLHVCTSVQMDTFHQWSVFSGICHNLLFQVRHQQNVSPICAHVTVTVTIFHAVFCLLLTFDLVSQWVPGRASWVKKKRWDLNLEGMLMVVRTI